MKISSPSRLAAVLKIAPSRGLEAVIKAQLIAAITEQAQRKALTHAQIALKSKIPRSAVTGILSGSLQKVSLGRVLRMLEAVELTVEVKVNKAA